MTTAHSQVRVVSEPLETTLRRMETLVARMEHRYECSSDRLLAEIKTGRIRETAEIAMWLTEYSNLKKLRGEIANGPTTGIPTSNTR